ncbi:MAG: hypothetical protein ACREQP_00355 [Candidatus Binatia bacterium]
MVAFAWVILFGAALLEVAGDGIIRVGLRDGGWGPIVIGCLMLSFYGVAVNSMSWDFSKLLGVYVAFFALISVLYGRFVFDEAVPASTWLGCSLIAAGGLVIYFGPK